MCTKQRIQELVKERKMTVAELERKVGISNGTIGKWDKSVPSTESLKVVAEKLQTTTDYLLGLTDDPNPRSSEKLSGNTQSPQYKMIQRKASRLSEGDQSRLLALIDITFKDVFGDEED